ncbi:alpha/beta fold hydrolase [Polymorphobacter sp.]|uniref:alpha/beta fold hydrolase n=1 Tax=Polymorphobacter sp. TaxID=1909290 RepID=UPI003F723150
MRYTKAYVNLPDGQIHYAMMAGEGVPIVFIHKTVSTYRMWLPVMRALAGKAPLIALETPGFGESFDPPGPVPIERYADWLGDAIAALGIQRCHLVGHHTGAVVALALADRRPALAASLTLIGVLPLTPEERADHGTRFGTPFRPEASGAYLQDTWNYVRWAGADSPDLANREMSAMLRSWRTRSWTYGAVWDYDFAAAFQRVQAPLLIMSAPDDVLHPYFERAQAMRQDALPVLLSGGVNYQTDLVPEEIASALWTRVSSLSQE